jgi:hypothetical protein
MHHTFPNPTSTCTRTRTCTFKCRPRFHTMNRDILIHNYIHSRVQFVLPVPTSIVPTSIIPNVPLHIRVVHTLHLLLSTLWKKKQNIQGTTSTSTRRGVHYLVSRWVASLRQRQILSCTLLYCLIFNDLLVLGLNPLPARKVWWREGGAATTAATLISGFSKFHEEIFSNIDTGPGPLGPDFYLCSIGMNNQLKNMY